MCALPAVTPPVHFRLDLVESRDPPDSGERIQKLGDFQFATSQHGLAVAEQQHVKVVVEQFAQRSFKLEGSSSLGSGIKLSAPGGLPMIASPRSRMPPISRETTRCAGSK